jgi:hypothetical protein
LSRGGNGFSPLPLFLIISLPFPDNDIVDTKTKTYYEIHSKRGHVSTTEDEYGVREALAKNLLVVEVQEMALYLAGAIVRTSVYRQIEAIGKTS